MKVLLKNILLEVLVEVDSDRFIFFVGSTEVKQLLIKFLTGCLYKIFYKSHVGEIFNTSCTYFAIKFCEFNAAQFNFLFCWTGFCKAEYLVIWRLTNDCNNLFVEQYHLWSYKWIWINIISLKIEKLLYRFV